MAFCRIVVFAVLPFTLGACKAPPRPLRVGLVVWPPYEMPVLARSMGRLDPKRVELLDYGSAAEAVRSYRNGVVDGVALPTTYLVESLAGGAVDRVVLVADVSNGGDALVASTSITDLRGLKGRRIGVESGSLGTLVLLRALQSAGLTPDEVELVPIDVSGHDSAFAGGRVDAVVTYEPSRSRLLAAGAHELFNSSAMPNEIVDVLVVRDTATRERAADVQLLVSAWLDGVQYLRDSPLDAARRVGPRENLDAATFLETLRGIRILGLEENRRWLQGPKPLFDDHLQSLASAMRSTGMIGGPITVAPVPDGRFLQ